MVEMLEIFSCIRPSEFLSCLWYLSVVRLFQGHILVLFILVFELPLVFLGSRVISAVRRMKRLLNMPLSICRRFGTLILEIFRLSTEGVIGSEL